ncbi:hypothetical protein Noda2021_07730 [Candidatus Dependentiae bacterium Noda2021]|nr:hypothetical protein Noda2021_07730 [Candidatus Dependentiae bacterium Noda2021]
MRKISFFIFATMLVANTQHAYSEQTNLDALADDIMQTESDGERSNKCKTYDRVCAQKIAVKHNLCAHQVTAQSVCANEIQTQSLSADTLSAELLRSDVITADSATITNITGVLTLNGLPLSVFGEFGPTGAQGTQGATGAPGLSGLTGNTGLQGQTGNTGAIQNPQSFIMSEKDDLQAAADTFDPQIISFTFDIISSGWVRAGAVFTCPQTSLYQISYSLNFDTSDTSPAPITGLVLLNGTTVGNAIPSSYSASAFAGQSTPTALFQTFIVSLTAGDELRLAFIAEPLGVLNPSPIQLIPSPISATIAINRIG